MKKFVLELSQGSQHLGSWNVGDEPITMRIIDDDNVVLEVALRTPEQKSSGIAFGRQEGDDFTMPIPVGEEEPPSSPLGFDLSQQLPLAHESKDIDVVVSERKENAIVVAEPELLPEESELSFEMSSSIMFGQDFESNDFVDEEPVIDFDALGDSDVDQSIEFVAPTPNVLDALRESINGIDSICAIHDEEFEQPPALPEIEGGEELDIAVWKQVGGHWTCIDRLKANGEYSFYSVRIWVDNSAALLLTGSDDMMILVQDVNEEEKEYQGINGSLPLPPRAIVLLQKGEDSICFRPE